MKPDWEAIKAEYIAGGVSQQELANAHGVSYRQLRERAQKEKWTALRQKTGEKTAEKLVQTITDAKLKKIERIVNQLLTQTELAAKQNTKRPKTIRETEELDDGRVRVTMRTEYEETKVVDKAGLKMLAQTVSALDEILRRQRQEDSGSGQDNAIHVVFEGMEGLEE